MQREAAMYCPKCGQEYREGASVCADCGVALTRDPAKPRQKPAAERLDLETVLETSDPAMLMVARSLLEAEGIPCFLRGELLQDFIGLGRLASGTNFITGPVELQVPAARKAEAQRLLAADHVATLERPADETTVG